MMVLLYQLDCNKVLSLIEAGDQALEHETNTNNSEIEPSDYWDNTLNSISVCGLPVSPVPLSSLWTPGLEDARPERESWERTRWTWEQRTLETERQRITVKDKMRSPPVYNFLIETDSEAEDRGDICDDDYGEVADNRLPNIILDHKQELCRQTNRDGRDHFPDILNSVRDNATAPQRTVIPIIIINDTSNALSDDDEMEDYYDNHKEWPPGLVR